MTTPTPDPATEQWLTEHHVTWTFDPRFPLENIDVTRSLANQARVGEPLIEDVVDRYTADYQRGDLFPPLIARRNSKRSAKITLLGGNHRRAAATAAKHTTHPLYIVDVTDELALTLMYSDNRRHGMPPAKNERLAQAAHLVDNGWTARNAAALVGVNEPALSNYRNVTRTSRRAADLGIATTYDTLATGHKTRLATLRSDPVFTAATRLTATAHLTQPETNDLVTRLNDCRSDTEALKLIDTETESLRTRMQNTAARPGPVKITAYGKLNSALAAIADIAAADIATPDTASLQRLRTRVKAAAMHLAELHDSLKAR
jgi:hypothetical protein